MAETERVRGATIGATIMGGFGAVWLALGMVSASVPWRVGIALVLPVFLLIAFSGALVRRRFPKLTGVETPEKKQMMQTFWMINVAQWLAIFGVVNLLNNLHLERWVVPVIVLVVGAHFLPLARIFQAPQHRLTGIAMMLCAMAAVMLPFSIRDTVECVMAGLILWISAAGALRAAYRRMPPRQLASAGL